MLIHIFLNEYLMQLSHGVKTLSNTCGITKLLSSEFFTECPQHKIVLIDSTVKQSSLLPSSAPGYPYPLPTLLNPSLCP